MAEVHRANGRSGAPHRVVPELAGNRRCFDLGKRKGEGSLLNVVDRVAVSVERHGGFPQSSRYFPNGSVFNALFVGYFQRFGVNDLSCERCGSIVAVPSAFHVRHRSSMPFWEVDTNR